MLGRLVLALLQIAGAWFGADAIAQYVPLSGDIMTFVKALIIGALVWVIGLVGFEVIKDTWRPSSSALIVTMVAAALATALMFVPQVMQVVDRVVYLSILGAVIGYQLKR